MNPTAHEILLNPQPSGHIVYPYTDDSQIADAVSLFAGAGLRKGEAVLLVVSALHLEPIKARLEQEGLNLAALEESGQLVYREAESLLATFMFDGIIDNLRFKTTIGALIEEAKAGDGEGSVRPVRVFGEMVDLIWMSYPNATQRLEELWNEVIGTHSVPLLCAYSLAGSRPDALPASLLSCHSHTLA